ncbi:MAG: autotransporter outer membrane beta-barrel domain-containing protein [Muribaculaceae bacterium]|nr:autotransporter outer membrane beta-barrel domain-containing protein [Muribaculaceae bacterium]
MNKILVSLFMIIMSCQIVLAQIEETSQITSEDIIVLPDTIIRRDTIVIKEVITRTDVVHRTEKVIRYEEKNTGSSEFRIKNESESQPSLIPGEISNTSVLQSQERFMESEPENSAGESDSDLFPYKPAGGNFIWVPDSMETSVKELLSGNYKNKLGGNTEETKDVDLNEKVIVKGDTIPMILKDRNLGRFDRGLFNYLFIPKGIWQVGLTASYGEFSTSDLEILDLVSDIDFNGKIFSVRPYFSYFLKSNISLGLRLGYTRGQANIGSFKVDIDEDMSFNLHDIMYKSNSYSAAVTFAQYLGITRKGRFGVFNEVELALSGGNSDFHRPFNGEMRETHTTTFQAALNFSPGVCVYVLDPVSFNVSLGVFGLNIKHEKQKVNGESLGWRTTSGANFRFNIFNINFGIAVNI